MVHAVIGGRKAFLLAASAACSILASGIFVTARAADGAKGKAIIYEAKVTSDQGDWYFKVELEPVLFKLMTVQNKYKVLRVNVNNRSKKPLQLSLANDRLQIYSDSGGAAQTVDGFLDMSRADPGWWKNLDQGLKSDLAYPDALIKANEEENIFVFVPADKLPSLPAALAFTISSYSANPIMIVRRNLATAK